MTIHRATKQEYESAPPSRRYIRDISVSGKVQREYYVRVEQKHKKEAKREGGY